MLLIHSLNEFSDLFLDIFKTIGVSNICEIGAESGKATEVYLSALRKFGGNLTTIDPAPSKHIIELSSKYSDIITLMQDTSLNAIPEVKEIDCWLIDGDHNWYTVFNELKLIEENCKRDNKPFFSILHDVGWPCAYRDQYYNPDLIPSDYRHKHSWNKGVHLDTDELVQNGFWGAGKFAYAEYQGGDKNGVLTAVKDFVEASQYKFVLYIIPAIFGVGILIDMRHPFISELSSLLDALTRYSFIETLEYNRVENYLQVLHLQSK